jgi:hypothetical protein
MLATGWGYKFVAYLTTIIKIRGIISRDREMIINCEFILGWRHVVPYFRAISGHLP